MKKADSGTGANTMQDKDEYLEAWSEGETTKEADPIVEAVKESQKSDADEYRDAYENENFGITPTSADVEVGGPMSTGSPEGKALPPSFKSFGDAFAWHRKNGDAEFKWNGKNYTTKMADEKSSKPAASKTQDKPKAASPAEQAATGAEKAAPEAVKPKPAAAKDERPWYEFGPRNTFIREGDNPKNPIYSSKPASTKSRDEMYFKGNGR